MAEEDAPAARRHGRRAVGFGAGAQILVEFVDGGGRPRSLQAHVEQSTADRMVLQPLPNQPGAAVPDIGRRVHLRFLREVGSAVARVVSRGSPESPLVLTRPMRLVRESRRRLYRIDVQLAAETSLGPARVVNLSGSGCLLALPEGDDPAAPGTQVEVRLPLPGAPTPVRVRGRIVREFRPEAGGRRIGVDFGRLPAREEDAIVRYVFLRQAELLRRGLLSPDRDPGAAPR